MQGHTKNNCLIIRPFYANIYNTMYLKSIIKSSLSETITWKNASKTQRKLTGEHLMQKCDSNNVAAMHLYWNHSSGFLVYESLFSKKQVLEKDVQLTILSSLLFVYLYKTDYGKINIETNSGIAASTRTTSLTWRH